MRFFPAWVRAGAVMAALMFVAGLATGCATAPLVPRPDHLLADANFGAPVERVGTDDVFALSDAMRAYARTEIAALQRIEGRNRGLFEALYRGKGGLKLDYDAVTRNAAEAFDARAGNCLSLVIMTAAFAKELGIDFQYQAAVNEAAWTRAGGLVIRNGHINLTLGNKIGDLGNPRFDPPLMIDFLPPEELRGLRTRRIGEHTVLAMFMNNRATEALVAGRIDDAYWWVRGAIDHDPAFLKSYNTLGVVYHRHGDLEPAARALRYVLDHDAGNVAALANLARVERQRGDLAQADTLERALGRVERDPPFHFFQLGQQAMQRGEFGAARAWFVRELDRDPFNHEFHFWLAQADYRLGNLAQAKEELQRALDNSTTRGDRQRYSAKLAWLAAQSRPRPSLPPQGRHSPDAAGAVPP